MKNPSWTKDELILALDVYLGIYPKTPEESLDEIIELSKLLQSMSPKSYAANTTFRSSTGVTMKFMNFRSIDPRYSGLGLSAKSKVDQEVWDEFFSDPKKLKSRVELLKKNKSLFSEFEDNDYMVEAPEGRIISRMHSVRERNPQLVKRKKVKVLREKGKLVCSVCGFDYKEVYGERGDAFIECHHIMPLHELGASITKLDDLVLICANCHRMIHAKKPWLSLQQLKKIYEDNKI